MVYGIIKLINFAHGDIYGRCLYGIFLIELVESELLCSLALAMDWDSYFGGCDWIPGLSSASSFDSDCSLDHSHRVPSCSNMGWSSSSVPIPVPSRKWLKQVRYNFGPISISNIQLMILEYLFLDGRSFNLLFKRQRWGKPCGAVSVDRMPLNWWGLT